MTWEATHAAATGGGAGGIGAELSSQLADAGATVHRLDLAAGFDATDPQQCSDFSPTTPTSRPLFTPPVSPYQGS